MVRWGRSSLQLPIGMDNDCCNYQEKKQQRLYFLPQSERTDMTVTCRAFQSSPRHSGYANYVRALACSFGAGAKSTIVLMYQKLFRGKFSKYLV